MNTDPHHHIEVTATIGNPTHYRSNYNIKFINQIGGLKYIIINILNILIINNNLILPKKPDLTGSFGNLT